MAKSLGLDSRAAAMVRTAQQRMATFDRGDPTRRGVCIVNEKVDTMWDLLIDTRRELLRRPRPSPLKTRRLR